MSGQTAELRARSATGQSRIGEGASNLPSLSEVLQAGQLVASLERLRDEIAADLEECQSMRDKAALYMRLTDVLSRIEEARPVKSKGDAVDEIAARRAARRTSAAPNTSRSKHSS